MGEEGGGEDSTIGRTKPPREQSLEHTFPLSIVGSISNQNCPLVEVGRGLQVDQCLSCRCWWACSFVQPESRKHTIRQPTQKTFWGSQMLRVTTRGQSTCGLPSIQENMALFAGGGGLRATESATIGCLFFPYSASHMAFEHRGNMHPRETKEVVDLISS